MKTARIVVDRDYVISRVDPRLYGAFVEHLGRVVYGGLYQPGHPCADAEGFRQDVLKLVRQIGVPICRYPGGNFVSGFDWEDSVGPDRRPSLNLAWDSIEPNTFGLHEFCSWAEKAGSEVLYAVNLGTRTPRDARNLVEYANFPSGSRYSDQRIRNGRREPLNIRTWCLGNEMDGVWQMGQKTGREYGETAREAAKLMRRVDRNIELVACGSSSSWMDTVGQWELDVLDVCYDEVDYISLHRYYENKYGNTASYLADALDMEQYIRTIQSACDVTKGKKRSTKTMNLSFDEWNVGYHARARDAQLHRDHPWTHALPIMQDEYNFEDALFVGSMLITLLRHSDRIRIACIAQLVNGIAPIMTSDTGCWAQTIFYPYLHASRFGRGEALSLRIDCPRYDTPDYTGVPEIDAVAICTEEGEINIFCINRSLTEDTVLTLNLRSFGPLRPLEHILLHHDDVFAVNTEAAPDTVAPVSRPLPAPEGGQLSVSVPALSWNVLRLSREETSRSVFPLDPLDGVGFVKKGVFP